MSTDYYLACDDCKEVVYVASSKALGVSIGSNVLIPNFVIKHEGHAVRILREGDDIICDDLYKKWTLDSMGVLDREDNYRPITST